MRRGLSVAGAAVFLTLFSAARADAALPSSQRSVVKHYVQALAGRRYTAAFGLLTPDERRYFGTPANFASGFQAERLAIDAFRITASRPQGAALGTVVLVSERIAFFDFAHQLLARATVTVPYGVIGAAPPRIKDPYHPWRAMAVSDSASSGGLRISLRKLSFFTGRLEAIITFANLGTRPVTLLPYGRSVVRDDGGKAYVPLETRLPSLTDRTLYTGLRLSGNAQYTGLMTFATPARFEPAGLSFTFGPALLDGTDAPFEIALPRFALAGPRG